MTAPQDPRPSEAGLGRSVAVVAAVFAVLCLIAFSPSWASSPAPAPALVVDSGTPAADLSARPSPTRGQVTPIAYIPEDNIGITIYRGDGNGSQAWKDRQCAELLQDYPAGTSCQVLPESAGYIGPDQSATDLICRDPRTPAWVCKVGA